MTDGLTKRLDLTLTIEELREINEMVDKGDYADGDCVMISQVLRPSRTATTVLMPGETVYVKVGGKASSGV